tara:strand:- start:73 stop:852 length:780 start_codon:yes stop_codon:yes gene_type:complete
MDLMLDGKVAIVSGGSKGIGAAIAKVLLSEGCNVIIGGRNLKDLSKTCKDLESNIQDGRQIFAFKGDLTESNIPEKFISFAIEKFKGLDILINNVGGSISGGIQEISDKNWDNAFQLNLYQAVKCSRLAVPEMKKGDGGSILNVASIYGRESKGSMTYNASKAALISFSKALAFETAEDNIRVNCIAPGSVIFKGGGWEKKMLSSDDGLKSFIESDLPLKRFGRPEEIATVAAFMVSPKASLVHGACWNVDGCQSLSNI